MNVFDLLAPDFALIALGYALHRHAGFGDAFWAQLERLVYFVLFPALLFGALARSDIAIGAASGLIATGTAFTIAGMALGYLAKPLFGPPPMTFAAGFQCAFRFNTYIGLAIMGGLRGVDGVAVFGLLVGFMVPLVNAAAVWTLARHGGASVAREFARNPLVLATLGGLAWNLAGFPLPAFAGTALRYLGEAAMPIGLVAVGAGLQWRALARYKRLMVYLAAVKLLAVPAVAVLIGRALALDGAYFDAALVLAALPAASSAYILANRMGGDGRFVASLMTFEVVAAMATLPFWLTMAGVPGGGFQ